MRAYDHPDVRVEYSWGLRGGSALEVIALCTPVDAHGVAILDVQASPVSFEIARLTERGATFEEARNRVLRALGARVAIREYTEGADEEVAALLRESTDD